MKKQSKCFVLFSGCLGSYDGIAIAAFLKKSTLRDYVRKNYQDMRGKKRQWKSEMYWQDDSSWLRCRDLTDEVPLFV